MFFKKRKKWVRVKEKAPTVKSKLVEFVDPVPFHQSCRRLDIAGPNDFGHLHEESYDGEFCKTPWVRVLFSLPCADWNEFRKTSHFESLAQFLEECDKRSHQSQSLNLED